MDISNGNLDQIIECLAARATTKDRTEKIRYAIAGLEALLKNYQQADTDEPLESGQERLIVYGAIVDQLSNDGRATEREQYIRDYARGLF